MAEGKISFEFHDEDFKEIEIEDQSSPSRPSLIYIPKSVSSSLNNNFQTNESAPRTPQQLSTPMIIPISERDLKFTQCIRYAKFIRIMSILESLFTFIFLIAPDGMKFLMFLIIVPVIGFLAGRYYKIWLAVTYLVYIVLLAIVRIILMAILYDALLTTLEVLVIVIDILVGRILWKFIAALRMLTESERRDLRILQNGVKKGSHMQQHTDQFGPANLIR
ncbi:unnamed protein product [Blepharisma stoltei]|uniref:Uncharacterized protein n=1 Tax=Blepharisma stoltei TaxID=1481888 RepID=A0AAU9IYH1_9CILI|nr:unnamed protein product [Blepharisma stoltei]